MKTPLPETTPGSAHAHADAGFPVLPVHTTYPDGRCTCGNPECSSPGKHPRTDHGVKDASRDHEQIDAWWSERGPEVGLGVATGEVSNVWVLDVDGRKGAESLAALTATHGRLPDTVTVRTPGGGWHLYFRMPADRHVGCPVGRVEEKIDVRGTGGYVIAPPSPHPSGGRYRWIRDPFEHPIAKAPDWLLDRVCTQPVADLPMPEPIEADHRDRYIAVAIETECRQLAQTPEGARNDQLNRSAFALARFVAAGDADANLVTWHLARAARAAGLAPLEVEKTLISALGARGAA